MAFTPDTPQEVTPATVAVVANAYRIRKLSLDMGNPDGTVPPVFEILLAHGSMVDGLFVAEGRDVYEITQLAEIGALMATVPLAGENLSQTTERAAFQYLMDNGFVPSGSIEV